MNGARSIGKLGGCQLAVDSASSVKASRQPSSGSRWSGLPILQFARAIARLRLVPQQCVTPLTTNFGPPRLPKGDRLLRGHLLGGADRISKVRPETTSHGHSIPDNQPSVFVRRARAQHRIGTNVAHQTPAIVAFPGRNPQEPNRLLSDRSAVRICPRAPANPWPHDSRHRWGWLAICVCVTQVVERLSTCLARPTWPTQM